MAAEAGRVPAGWPFFAPSRAEAIAEALDLAEVGPGSYLVDLGCGEGEVLVAAARRGARVVGVEYDPQLADAAREAMAAAGFETGGHGEVVVADLFDPDVWPALLEPEPVLFAYLSPAVLQRLTPLLRRMAGRRGCTLVTVDFDVPDLLADRRTRSARLYRLPGRQRRATPRRVGWPTAGTLCVMPSEVHSLTTLEAISDGQPVDLRVTGEIADRADAAAGVDQTAAGRPVAVDLRWHEQEPGILAEGTIHVGGLPPHPVFVLFTDDEQQEQGQWDLSPAGARNLADFLHHRSAPSGPPTTTDLLHAAEG